MAYYNDSKATNTDSAIKALETFENGIVLLAGGDDKLTDLTDFMQLCKKRVSDLVLLGAAAERFEQEALKNGYPAEHIHRLLDGKGSGKSTCLGEGTAGGTVIASVCKL